eukprot:TRINITY_DN3480_c0_g1_i5.p1 TRINITY_DN3480_c0_g1~~TRINITY_DN3480_c0_g1_i5.p1  ORF type:complete len:573 (+),score=105.67 TRINITY_DN3480_c0_g1_i5:73-1791(+)
MSETTVGEYLIERLKEVGVDDIFGVPGDFVIPFMHQIEENKSIRLINTCNELNAAYAADGYARIRGVGCVCTTFGVGELSAINGVAGSFAERIPVVAITGTPSMEKQRANVMLHHTAGPYDTQTKMFAMITAYAAFLSDPETAPDEIDRALTECLSQKRPVYINLPADVTKMTCRRSRGKISPREVLSDQTALAQILDEAVAMIDSASLPVIVADAEISRFGYQKEFAQLLSASGLPYTCLMMGKTLLDESNPQFIGLYMGDRSRKYVEQRVSKADCVLAIGLVMSDLNTGGFTLNIPREKEIRVHNDVVTIRGRDFKNVSMKDFMVGLSNRLKRRDPSTLDMHNASEGCTHRRSEGYEPVTNQKLTATRFFDRMAHYIPENAIVLAETGLSMFGAAEVFMPSGVTFIGQVFYGSIGFTVGATLGVCVAAPERPVVLFVGDGSFQVTCQDLSTMIRFKTKPTIFLINNDGYTIERLIQDGSFNDIQPWKYHKLPLIFGGSEGYEVSQEGGLEVTLRHVEEHHERLNLVEIHLDRMDCTEPLRKAGMLMLEQSEQKLKDVANKLNEKMSLTAN